MFSTNEPESEIVVSVLGEITDGEIPFTDEC